MADGKTHFVHNLVAAGAISAASYYLGLPPQLVVIGNLFGIIFTPDIDIESKTYTEAKFAHIISKGFARKKKNREKIARFFASLIQVITAPYAFLIPHRSWLSHLPPFSVVTQMIYFYFIYFCFCRIFRFDYVTIENLWNYQYELTVLGIIIFVHHFCHLVGDGGLVIFFGKKWYTMTYPFYLLTKKMFPQGKD